MLQSLRIRNLALLEEVVLDFAPGFTAVTGETGAGKSILLGALSLLAGERGDKTIIRAGAASCEVEAVLGFADPARIDAALAALDLPPCEEGTLILKRSVARDRPARITVNGSLATLAALQRLGAWWIDFHGPGEPRRLLREACQLELLDLFGRAAPALAVYGTAYRTWRELEGRREALAGEARLSPDEVAFLERQLAALDRLELTAEAVAGLERDALRIARAQELTALASALETGLSGEEGALARLAALVREGRRLEALDPASKPLADRLASTVIELADLAGEFAALGRDLQFDAEAAAALEAKMNAWLEARRRHGGDVAAVAAARERLRSRLAAQGDLAGALARLDREIAAAERGARQAAAGLRAVRERAAGELARAAAKGIAALGFKRAEFQVAVGRPGELGPTGDAGCEFLFSPNVGEAPLPLSRIASSGELARVMLALKTVLADLDQVPLLVFDEVDANVGGEIGRVVGEKMAGIAARHQVLCVTHLPQVAAQASSHLVVTKDQSGERAAVSIAPIHENRKARVGELARMLGDRGARSALAHAEELLRAG
jgi:DNA repair protein RecN (Recombination protein N)